MVNRKFKNIKLKKLKTFYSKNGNVMRVFRGKEMNKIKETYFSVINFNKVKAWKFHKKMSLNLFVSKGKVRFVFFLKNRFKIIEIDEKKNLLLKIPPKIWFGFKGLKKPNSLILNLADAIHNKNEQIVRDIKYFNYNWNKK